MLPLVRIDQGGRDPLLRINLRYPCLFQTDQEGPLFNLFTLNSPVLAVAHRAVLHTPAP